ncbi:hypothetical protein SKAU_G00029300 [Synaphobranchus kaupii]|uniref:Uncharacterized protein n=1 Tax=Synaphobranchus kaupii TaxID=118154 RepID=A0A9Q1JFK2_SYNKA|nr:hypothetical protein SKAU_G00029300 [Synaphobranchus kaupii]
MDNSIAPAETAHSVPVCSTAPESDLREQVISESGVLSEQAEQVGVERVLVTVLVQPSRLCRGDLHMD